MCMITIWFGTGNVPVYPSFLQMRISAFIAFTMKQALIMLETKFGPQISQQQTTGLTRTHTQASV